MEPTGQRTEKHLCVVQNVDVNNDQAWTQLLFKYCLYAGWGCFCPVLLFSVTQEWPPLTLFNISSF